MMSTCCWKQLKANLLLIFALILAFKITEMFTIFLSHADCGSIFLKKKKGGGCLYFPVFALKVIIL